MRQDLFRIQSFFGVYDEDLPNQRLRVVGYIVPVRRREFKLTLFDHIEKCRVVVVIERGEAAEPRNIRSVKKEERKVSEFTKTLRSSKP
jgi:hypothetical protein